MSVKNALVSKVAKVPLPGLNYLIQNAGKDGVEEVIIGMAHRGRLNVLVNILGKKPGDLFAEFEGRAEIKLPSGDVNTTWGSAPTSLRRTARCTFLWHSTRHTWKSLTQ